VQPFDSRYHGYISTIETRLKLTSETLAVNNMASTSPKATDLHVLRAARAIYSPAILGFQYATLPGYAKQTVYINTFISLNMLFL